MTIDAPRDASGAAAALEAYFLRRVLAEVKTDGGLAGGGFAGSTFHEMFCDALADSMASAGGIGLAKQIEVQLAGGAAGMAAGPTALSPQAAAGRYAASGPRLSVLPVNANMTWGVGDRVINGHFGHHRGVDLSVAQGTPVKAAGPGRVVRAEDAGNYGNLVVIDHGGGLETRYAHLSHIAVRVGDRVEPGQSVGDSGETGNAAGPHLHFEVRRDGEVMDPTRELPGLGHRTRPPQVRR